MNQAHPETFPSRLGIQQRLLPAYRAPFFGALAEVCPAGLSVFAGQPWPGEAMGPEAQLEAAQVTRARNLYLIGGRFTLVWQRGWRAWLEAWRPQALILEANPRNLTVPRMAGWMRKQKLPVVGWGLGSGLGSTRRSTLWRRFLGSFDTVITYSRAGADAYTRAGFPYERIFVAPNAVSARPTHPPPERPEGFAGKPSVLYVGRLQPRKRVDMLLEACARLPGPLQPRLMIAGDGPAREALEALARRVYPQGEFLGDRRGEALEALYAAADLFVLPGTGGLAVQQAMAYGLPVLVGEADGTQADLVRPENGWCVANGGDPVGALTEALSQALASPARLRRMGLASYRIVAEEINIESMVSAFLAALACAAEIAGNKD